MSGRDKGQEFEREIARRLTEWCCGKQKPEWFWRTAGSGGKATGDIKKGIKGKGWGDIMAIDKRGQWFTDIFGIELKFYKKLDIPLFLVGKGNVFSWWLKTQNAYRSGRYPLLIFKGNGTPIYMGVSLEIFDLLRDLWGFNGDLIHARLAVKADYFGYNGYPQIPPFPGIGLFLFNDFLEYFKANNLKQFIKGNNFSKPGLIHKEFFAWLKSEQDKNKKKLTKKDNEDIVKGLEEGPNKPNKNRR